MGKNKNLEERNRILRTAYALFREKGYANTSFKDIADAANIQKALVQHYFPKKEMFINLFIEEALDIISKSIQRGGFEKEKSLNNLYLIGYFQFWYLINHEYMQYLKYDIVLSRKNTRTVILIVTDWALKYMHIEDEHEKKALSDAIAIAIGGAFEYVYMRFCDAQPISTKDIVDKIVLLINAMLGIYVPDFYVGEILSEEWLKEKSDELNRIIFEM